MQILIKGEPKEIAALVSRLQERQESGLSDAVIQHLLAQNQSGQPFQ